MLLLFHNNNCYRKAIVTGKQLLLESSCYWKAVVTGKQLLLESNCYRKAVVTGKQLLPESSCYRKAVVTGKRHIFTLHLVFVFCEMYYVLLLVFLGTAVG